MKILFLSLMISCYRDILYIFSTRLLLKPTDFHFSFTLFIRYTVSLCGYASGSIVLQIKRKLSWILFILHFVYFSFLIHIDVYRDTSIKIFSLRILRMYVYAYATKEKKKRKKNKKKKKQEKWERLIISQYRTQSLYEIADRTA